MHFHWHKLVKAGRNGNAYLQCRCGSRQINHPDKTQPMNYQWLVTGIFQEMPARGPFGSAGQAKADLEPSYYEQKREW